MKAFSWRGVAILPVALMLVAAAPRIAPISFRFLKPVIEPRPRPAESPIQLTSSDGQGLRLQRLHSRSVIQGPLAFTELHLTFSNPEDRVIEGRFRIVLPQEASISRFAMKLADGRWQEGEVVERVKARAAYEDFLHRRQDPALLEQAAGNEFAARVFPIPASGVKELLVSYSEELKSGGRPLALPLYGLKEIGEIDAAVHAGGRVIGQIQKRSFTPQSDFETPLPASAAARGGDVAAARVRVPLPHAPDPVASLLVLFDTSASRALGMDRQLGLLERLIEALAAGAGPNTPVTVLAFDQDVAEIYSGGAGGFGPGALAALRRRKAMGASDLGLAFSRAQESLRKHPAARVLLVSDGMTTAGVQGEELRERVLKLRGAGARRLDAIALGGIRDEAALRRLTTAGLDRDGAVIDGTLPAPAVASRLTEATRSGLRVEAEGAAWVWPETLDGMQAGDETVVYAGLPAAKSLKISIGGRVAEAPAVVDVEPELLSRAAARAGIARRLEAREKAKTPEERGRLEAEIVALSVRARVLCPLTALLVLETERDYARFGIDRRALAGILTLDGPRVKIVARAPESVPVDPMPAPWTKLTSVPLRRAKASSRGLGGAAARQSALAMPATGAVRGGAAPDSLESSVPMAQGAAADAAESAAPMEEERSRGEASEAPRGFSRAAGAGHGGGAGGGALSGGGAGESLAMADARPQSAPAAAGAMAGAPPPPMPAPAPPMVGAAPMAAPARAGREARSDTERRRSVEDMVVPMERSRRRLPPGFDPRPGDEKTPGVDPFTGKYKEVMDLLAAKKNQEALDRARAWCSQEPGDVLALTALGRALEAVGDRAGAARAYGSIIDLFSDRADLRRYAGALLERLRSPSALALAADTFRRAVESRPDHPSSHRLLGFALLKRGAYREAFEAIEKGASRRYPEGRFRGVDRILREDLGLAGAAWIHADPDRRTEVLDRLRRVGARLEDAPSVRFILNWETDANDVDFHIRDAQGGHAFYSSPRLGSGGELYADVTTGYGPECFTVRGPRGSRAGPYTLQAHYYSRGPMGYGMGKLEIVEHDGRGGFSFEERPFVVMLDRAFVDLGSYK